MKGFLFVGIGLAAALAASAVEITKDWQIVIPDPAPMSVQKFLRQTAEEIRTDIREASGLDLSVVTAAADKGGPAIRLGAEFARAAGIAFDNFAWYDNAVEEKGGSVYLYGKDYVVRKTSLDWRRCVLPTVRAATRFLDEFLGVKFLLPGRVGREVPRLAKVTVPDGVRSVQRPKHVYGNGGQFPTQDMPWYFANNIWPSGAFKSYGGHTYPSACPVEKHFAEHPEYFALSGGKRVGEKGNPSLCISNPAVRDLVIAELIRQFDAGADVCQLAQQDGDMWCQCENCRAFYGTGDDWGEKLWRFHRDIAERMQELRPGKIVHILSYGRTASPPKSFRKFPSNVMVELCSYTEESFRRWKEYEVPQGFTVYIYEWGNYMRCGLVACRSLARMKTLARRFADNNVKGIFRCGFSECFGTCGPIYWAFDRLIEDPDADLGALLAEYTDAAFGPAAEQMRRFFLEQDRRLRYFDILAGDYAAPQGEYSRISVKPIEAHLLLFPPDSVRIREDALARAEATPGLTDKQKKRLELVRLEFDYAKTLGRIAPLFRAYQECPTKELFEPLADALVARKAVIDSIFRGQRLPPPLDGWPELRVFRGDIPRNVFNMNARLGGMMGAPLNWDVAYMREKGILPGASVKTTTALRAAEKPAGTDFTKGAWAGADWNELGGVQLETPLIEARFKVLYDDENLYLGVESDLPDDCIVRPRGRDAGLVACEEGVDVMVAPGATRDVCYHMLYNPVPDSRFDLALGLIKDPLNPKYNQFDADWNGTWTTEDRRAAGRWYSLVTIPCRDFGVAAPKPGDTWWLNVGRAANHTGHSADLRLLLWSPNLEQRSFVSTEAMGKLVFK